MQSEIKLVSISILLIILGHICVYSQKTERAPKLTINEFGQSDSIEKVIFYRAHITFPYEMRKMYPGALDTIFSVKNNITLRLKLNDNTNISLIKLASFNDTKDLKIKSIIYYTVKSGKINQLVVKRARNLLNDNNQDFFLDLNSIIGSTASVIDIVYSYTINSKKRIYIPLYNEFEYSNVAFMIDIPEIYNYTNISSIDFRTERKFLKNKIFIGYIPIGSNELIAYWEYSYIKNKNPHAAFNTAYCGINRYTFTLISNFHSTDNNGLNLILKSIKEIK